MDAAQAKEALYGHFAALAKVLAHPKRIEILEILAQGSTASSGSPPPRRSG